MLCYLLLGGSLTVLIWSFFGLAIARLATVRLGRGEIINLSDAVGFAMQKGVSCFLSPVMPFVTILLFAIPLMLAGLAMRADVGTAIVGLLWCVVLVAGLFMTGLAIGLFFGWPLMWGAIATESSDAFDAVSRSYSYTFS